MLEARWRAQYLPCTDGADTADRRGRRAAARGARSRPARGRIRRQRRREPTASPRTGRAVSRQELISTAWPLGAVVHDNTLDVYIARIRRKLRALQPAPAIKTVHGLGYRLQ